MEIEMNGGSASFLGALAKQEEALEETQPTPTLQPENQDETPVEEPQVPTQPEEEVTPTNEPEQEYYSSYFEEETTKPTPNLTEPTQASVKDKVKFSPKEYVETHASLINDYYRYSSMNLEEMSDLDLVKEKMKRDKPYLTAQDIQEELNDQFGLGLKKKTATEDSLPEEIDAINEHNERVDRQIAKGQRALKGASQEARNELSKLKDTLELPEMELDVEIGTDSTSIIEQYQAQQVEQAQKFRDEIWTPNITDAVSKVGGFNHKVEVEVQKGRDKVVSETNYKLSDTEKQELTEYLKTYVPQPSDDKYIVNAETGEVDYKRFVADKAKSLFTDKIIASSVKSAIAQFAQTWIKEEQINFQDEPRRVNPNAPQKRDTATTVFENRAQQYQSRMQR